MEKWKCVIFLPNSIGGREYAAEALGRRGFWGWNQRVFLFDADFTFSDIVCMLQKLCTLQYSHSYLRQSNTIAIKLRKTFNVSSYTRQFSHEKSFHSTFNAKVLLMHLFFSCVYKHYCALHWGVRETWWVTLIENTLEFRMCLHFLEFRLRFSTPTRVHHQRSQLHMFEIKDIITISHRLISWIFHHEGCFFLAHDHKMVENSVQV